MSVTTTAYGGIATGQSLCLLYAGGGNGADRVRTLAIAVPLVLPAETARICLLNIQSPENLVCIFWELARVVAHRAGECEVRLEGVALALCCPGEHRQDEMPEQASGQDVDLQAARCGPYGSVRQPLPDGSGRSRLDEGGEVLARTAPPSRLP